MRIREADTGDLPFLEQILLAAYNWSADRRTLDEIRTDEMARRYLAGFPAGGDLGLVALVDDTPAGAVWGRGVAGLSLSVEDGNTARRLYERAGFAVVGRNGGSDTMFLRLA